MQRAAIFWNVDYFAKYFVFYRAYANTSSRGLWLFTFNQAVLIRAKKCRENPRLEQIKLRKAENSRESNVSRYRRYVCIKEKNEETENSRWIGKGNTRRDDGGSPGNTWTSLIKMFQSFSRVMGFLLSRRRLVELSFASRRRNTSYIFMTGLPGLLTPIVTFFPTFLEIPSWT